MKKLIFLILTLGATLGATAQMSKTVYTLRDSTTIAADSSKIGPLNWNYIYTVPVQTWALDDTDAEVIQYGSETNLGPWVALDTLTLTAASGTLAMSGENMHYLYYKFQITLNTVTSGDVRIKMIRTKKR